MKRYLLLLTFIPLCLKAEFEALDSVNLGLIKGYTESLNYDVNTYLPYLEPIEDTVSSIDNSVNNLYQLFYDPSNGPDNHSVIYWSGLGSKAVYDFIGSSSIVNFPAIDSLRVLSSTSPDLAPSYNLWSYQSQTAPDFKSFLHGFVNRQFPLMYSLSSGVSDLDARAWRLQNQGAYSTNVLGRGIGDSWTYHVLPSPFSNAGVGWSFFDFNLNPTDAGNYLQTRTFSSSPDLGSSIVNFEKWFVDDYAARRDFWDSLAVARANTFYKISTNHYGFVEAYDVAISNIVQGIRDDNKKSSDVFSNLWSRDFRTFANVQSQQLKYMSAGNSENINLSSINVTNQPLSNNPQDSFSHRILLYFNAQNRVLTSINNYLYNFMKQLQDVRSKLDSLPSALSSALSSIDVTLDNPSITVSVDNFSDLVISNSSALSWHYDKSLITDGFMLGPAWSDLTPYQSKDILDASIDTFSSDGLTGNLNDDLPILLQLLIKQHGNNNTACFSILTNVQCLVGLNASINDKLTEREDDTPSDDYSSSVSSSRSELDGVITSFTSHQWDYSPSEWSEYSGGNGLLAYMRQNAVWRSHVEIDLSFFHTGSSQVAGGFDWGGVSGSAMRYSLDISKYKWFFDLMRCCSILGCWFLIFKLVLFFFKMYLKFMKFFYKIYTGLMAS